MILLLPTDFVQLGCATRFAVAGCLITKSISLQVLPLLLLHGWPGSIREFYETIPKLITPRKGYDFVFEVIAPSLPGFIYSDVSKGLCLLC